MYMRRLLWKIEDNSDRIVKFCVYATVLGIFWALFFYVPFSGEFK